MMNYKKIKTLFLDVGNTLISMDFNWISEKLFELGIPCDPGAIQRAEAAARPGLSAKIHESGNDPGFNTRAFFFSNLLENLPMEARMTVESIEPMAQRLIIDLFPEGSALRLWSHVLPGTHAALERFQAMGFPMHVISNSDGTVEKQLIQTRLRSFFGEVIDSWVVKVEKPDPRIFEMALEMAGCNAEDALYVGDIYHVDILGAQSAGMQAVLLDPYSDWGDIPCERVQNLTALVGRFLEE